MADFKKIICIDFDGVIHSYTSGWKGVDQVVDGPVAGAIQWLKDLVDDPDFEPVIYSSRSKDELGIAAMQDTICEWAYTEKVCDGDQLAYVDLKFPTEKPAAWLTIDDRAIQFVGKFPSKKEMSAFTPWNKEGSTVGKTSDGYHTFDELYQHRNLLWVNLCLIFHHNPTNNMVNPWKSKLHSDGSSYEGWFLLGVEMANWPTQKQITYHLPMEMWDDVKVIPEFEKAPEFDGHTSDDVLTRLLSLSIRLNK